MQSSRVIRIHCAPHDPACGRFDHRQIHYERILAVFRNCRSGRSGSGGPVLPSRAPARLEVTSADCASVARTHSAADRAIQRLAAPGYRPSATPRDLASEPRVIVAREDPFDAIIAPEDLPALVAAATEAGEERAHPRRPAARRSDDPTVASPSWSIAGTSIHRFTRRAGRDARARAHRSPRDRTVQGERNAASERTERALMPPEHEPRRTRGGVLRLRRLARCAVNRSRRPHTWCTVGPGSACRTGADLGLQNRWILARATDRRVRFPCASAILQSTLRSHLSRIPTPGTGQDPTSVCADSRLRFRPCSSTTT